MIKLNPEGQAKLITKAFGLQFIKPKFFNVDTDTMFTEQDQIKATILDNNLMHTYGSGSKFGLPVFDSVRFDYFAYSDNSNVLIKVNPFDIGTMLCDVQNTKHIIKTEVAGGNGTVKEYISNGDYNLSLKGVLCSEYQNVPPRDAILELMKFIKAPISFPITSNFLYHFGINQVVVERCRFTQIEGMRNVVGFELQCVSDTTTEQDMGMFKNKG